MERLKLYIRNADSSIYWVEYFNSITSLNIWLNEEKTRPYWKLEFTTEIFTLDDQDNETPYIGN